MTTLKAIGVVNFIIEAFPRLRQAKMITLIPEVVHLTGNMIEITAVRIDIRPNGYQMKEM